MPPQTCPMIDKLKRAIERTEELLNSEAGGSDDPGELRQLIIEAANEIRGEADALEDIRDANKALRNCAEYWQDEAERLASPCR